MINVGTYKFINLIQAKLHLFSPTEVKTEEVYDSENICTCTKQLVIILDDKYENAGKRLKPNSRIY